MCPDRRAVGHRRAPGRTVERLAEHPVAGDLRVPLAEPDEQEQRGRALDLGGQVLRRGPSERRHAARRQLRRPGLEPPRLAVGRVEPAEHQPVEVPPPGEVVVERLQHELPVRRIEALDRGRTGPAGRTGPVGRTRRTSRERIRRASRELGEPLRKIRATDRWCTTSWESGATSLPQPPRKPALGGTVPGSPPGTGHRSPHPAPRRRGREIVVARHLTSRLEGQPRTRQGRISGSSAVTVGDRLAGVGWQQGRCTVRRRPRENTHRPVTSPRKLTKLLRTACSQPCARTTAPLALIFYFGFRRRGEEITACES
jgi:hypothetical protein